MVDNKGGAGVGTGAGDVATATGFGVIDDIGTVPGLAGSEGCNGVARELCGNVAGRWGEGAAMLKSADIKSVRFLPLCNI